MDAQPQRRIADRYRLLEPIGQGGMGVVWKAHDELIDRVVAVKEVLHLAVREEDREKFNQRTIREARAAGRLSHPNVVVVHDVVEEDGRPWIVMQLVHARSLGDVLKTGGPLPPERVAAIGAQVLDALRTAHRAGVLHRDVKPENVLLGDDGRVVLTDFGIATMTQETALTMTGQISGTPAFMPPERLNGLPAVPESDLWSLGATLYAAVEGHPPFDRGAPVPTMAAILHDRPQPTRRAGPLAPVIEGLLRRDPTARMDVREVEELLRRVAAGGSSAGFHPEGPGRSGPGAGQFGSGDPAAVQSGFDSFGSGGPGPGAPSGYGSGSGASYPSGPSGGPGPGYAVPGAGHAPPGTDMGHAPTGPGAGGYEAAGSPGTFPGQWSRTPGPPGHDPGQAWGNPPQGPPGRTAPTYPEGHPGFRPAKRSRGGLIALAVGVPSLAVLGGVAWYALSGTGGGTAERTTPAAITAPGATDSTPPPSPAPESPAPESPTPKPTPSPTLSPTPSPTKDEVAVPSGWRLHKDRRGGFTVALPRDWTEFERANTSVKFHGPGSPGYLQIDWTEAEVPILDPVRAWEDLEQRVQREGKLPGYRRLRIEPRRYLGREAADWEFTWRLPSGTTAHVLNRGFRTADGKPFAVYWQTRDADWDRDRRFLLGFLSTFRAS